MIYFQKKQSDKKSTEKKVFIDGIAIDYEDKWIINNSSGYVRAGTNCPKGGDSEHGGRTFLEISLDSSAHLSASVNWIENDISLPQSPAVNKQRTVRNAKLIKLEIEGDESCKTLISLLEHALETLSSNFNKNSKKKKSKKKSNTTANSKKPKSKCAKLKKRSNK